jgi:hypothetical protein
MKRKTYGEGGPKIVKTSISLPEVLLEFAEGRCANEGFNTFSAYVAHLIRMDKERQDEKLMRAPPKNLSSSTSSAGTNSDVGHPSTSTAAKKPRAA